MTLLQRFKLLTIWNKLGVVAAIVGILGFIIAVITFVAWLIPEPPKPPPHLTLSFSTEDVPDDPIQLTNDFLRRKDFGPAFDVHGILFMPFQPGKTNLVFVISVKNEPDSRTLAEDLKLIITLPKELDCVAGQGWKQGKIQSPGYFSGATTNAEQSWGYDFAPILPGIADVTPPFQISQATANGQTYFSILLRAKDCPPEQITFTLMPILLPSNSPPHKGFILEGKLSSSNTMTFTHQQILENLRK